MFAAVLIAVTLQSHSPTADVPRHRCSVPAYAEPWSDPATWGGALPALGDSVMIPAGKTVVLDLNPPMLRDITIEGALHFGCQDIELRCDLITVLGELHLGSAALPNPHEVVIELGERFIPSADPLARTLEVLSGGVLELHGSPRSESWLRLGATAVSGATSLQLEGPVDWKPGEAIVLASTDFDLDQAEELTITSVTGGGTVIGFEPPLQYTHWGVVETHGVDQRGEVALLDRNVTVRGPAGAPAVLRGGQMRFLGSGSASIRISWIEVERMGVAGALGMYPIHFHMIGDATGSYVKALSIHHCFNRAVTIHSTQNVAVLDTLSYETLGHAFFLEDSSETGNRFVRNLALGTRRPPSGLMLESSDATPASFWIQNTDNTIVGNVAAGSEGHGFWFNTLSLTAMSTPPMFVDNVAHSNDQNGFYKQDYVVGVAPPAEYLGFTAYKNREVGVHYRSTNLQTTWRDARLADNATAFFIASSGLQKDKESYTLVTDSIVVGESGNVGNPQATAELQYGRSLPSPGNPTDELLGHEIYEGDIEVRDTIYANFEDAYIGGQRLAAAFGQVRFHNAWAIDPRIRVGGLAFTQANRVYLEPTLPFANGSASLLIYDIDGTLTGAPDHHIAANTPLLLPLLGATYIPSWNANVLPGPMGGNHYGSLRLLDYDYLAIPSIVLTSVTRGATQTVGQTVGSSSYPMNVLLPDVYDISFGGQPATRYFSLQLRFGAPQIGAVVAVEYTSPGPGQVKANGTTLSVSPNLASLLAVEGDGYFYDEILEKVFLKLVIGGSGTSFLDGTQKELLVIE